MTEETNMTYPQNWPALRDAALSYAPRESVADAYQRALTNAGSAVYRLTVTDSLGDTAYQDVSIILDSI